MKWMWVVLLAVLAPVSVQAELALSELVPISVQAARPLSGAYVTSLSEKVLKAQDPQMIRFLFGVLENGNFLRATFRFYVPKDHSVEGGLKGRCFLWVNHRRIPEFGEYWINGETGRELWFPSLQKRDRVALGVFWNKDNPFVEYASVAVESNRGTSTDRWMSYRAERFFQKRSVSDRAGYYRELSLDDVCSPYTLEEQIKEAKEKQ